MNITDFLIIYFSIGAPFAVYRYFQTRFTTTRKTSLFQILFTFLFWIPAALRLFSKFRFYRKMFSFDRVGKNIFNFEREKNLFSIQKNLEAVLLKENLKISIFEFRETLERFIGLTAAKNAADDEISETGKEFSLAAKNKNAKIAAKCFHRRNRQRLFFHQTLARQDFLRMLADLFSVVSEKAEFIKLTLEFNRLVNDREAQIAVEEMFANHSQSVNRSAVKILEKDLWKTQPRRPLPANSISTLMQPISATNLPNKD